MLNKITLSQKCILFTILLIKTIVYCTDVLKQGSVYSQLHLDARIQWLWDHDENIDQLKNIARTSPDKIFNYISEGENIARFDAKQKTVTIFVRSGQKLTLSYEMFDSFIKDPDLYDYAVERYFVLNSTKKNARRENPCPIL